MFKYSLIDQLFHYLKCFKIGGQYFAHTTKCYIITFETETWEGARAKCLEKFNGTLVTISDIETMNFIKTLKHRGNQIWIGASRTPSSSVWTWDDGSTWSYTNWLSGEPGVMDMSASYNSGGMWAGSPKSSKFYYLCQF